VTEISPAVLSAVANISSPPKTHTYGEKLSIDAANETGTTALIYAVKSHRLNTVKQLVEEFYATLDIRDDHGKTALDHAIALRYEDIVAYLKQQKQIQQQAGYKSAVLSSSSDVAINPFQKQNQNANAIGNAASNIHISNKQIRQLLKNKFASFNDMIETIYSQQRAYIVPDDELRFGLREEAQSTVTVKYSKLYTIGSQVNFSNTAEKYIKYKPDTVRGMIQELYQGV
jgi:ankyrin repeat protein